MRRPARSGPGGHPPPHSRMRDTHVCEAYGTPIYGGCSYASLYSCCKRFRVSDRPAPRAGPRPTRMRTRSPAFGGARW
jgi:hypothetical protein